MYNKDIMQYQKTTIAIVGSHNPISYSEHQLEFARVVGSHIAKYGGTVTTPADASIASWVALGSLESNGLVVGFSPASSKYEHENHFRLPSEDITHMVYTGFGFLGRDITMLRSSDAVLVFLNEDRVYHELVLAKELQKPVIAISFENDNDTNKRILGDLYGYVQIFNNQKDVVEKIRNIIKK